MSSMTSESEDMVMSNGHRDLHAVEEVSTGGNTVVGGPLKKGPWTSTEDAILVDYVNKHGEGNWNAVQKHSGLSRCGKSCRLRWANHLRPDLKKGSFTPEEERLIIELHAKMGNKWARMAAELPGRTDNEIKNYWNTRIKRRQRAGLPIYPPDVCLQTLNRNCQSQSMGSFSTGDRCFLDLLPTHNLEIPHVEFKNLELSQHLYPPALDIPDIPASSLLAQGLGSSCGSNFLFSGMHPPKRLRESESMLPGLSGAVCDVLPASNQYQLDGSEKITQSFGFSFAYDNDLNADHPSSSSLLSGSHALLNGNSSSSEPISWVMKSELPSLQYSDTQMCSWDTPSQLPSLETVDTLIQSPTEQTQSDCLSSRSSGLLEAVLYESRTLKNLKSSSCLQTSTAVMPGNTLDSLSENLCGPEWEVNGDPISPLGHSAASVFSEYTPVSGSSLDESQSIEYMPGCKVKKEAVDWVSKHYDAKYAISSKLIYSRPEFLLGSNWFGPNTERGKDHSILTDAIGALNGEDCF